MISLTRGHVRSRALMERHHISGFPVVEPDGRLVGILTHRDMRFAERPDQPVAELMTSQNLATLLLFRRPPGRVVVTVHDIIPYMLRNDPDLCVYRSVADRLFDQLAMAGLRRADQLIADSQHIQQARATFERALNDAAK